MSKVFHKKCKTLVYSIMSVRILNPSSRLGARLLIHFRRLTGIRPGSSCLRGMDIQAVSQSPLLRASAATSPCPEHLHSAFVHLDVLVSTVHLAVLVSTVHLAVLVTTVHLDVLVSTVHLDVLVTTVYLAVIVSSWQVGI